MRHSLLAAALLTALVAGCKAEAPPSPAASSASAPAASSQADARFAELSKRWLEGWLPLLHENLGTQCGRRARTVRPATADCLDDPRHRRLTVAQQPSSITNTLHLDVPVNIPHDTQRYVGKREVVRHRS